MIELNKLIVYFSERLQEHPPMTTLVWHDVCQSALAYLNGYRVTNVMLQSLAGNATALEAEARLP